MTKQEFMRKIYTEIDNIPPMPKHISKILKIIHNPDVSISQISDIVKQDAGLAANILRIANSAWYLTREPAKTVERALSLIGLRRLSSILQTIGAKQILDERYKSFKMVWKHSYICAFYAQNIMKLKSKQEEDIELAYLSGLIHDIGKLVLLSLSSELVESITNISKSKSVSITEIEKQALGLNHAEIGEKIASKWKFPPIITLAIKHHHDPENNYTEQEIIDLIYTTYLANILAKYKTIELELLDTIHPSVLQYFNISEEEQFIDVIEKLNDDYQTALDIQFI